MGISVDKFVGVWMGGCGVDAGWMGVLGDGWIDGWMDREVS